MNKYFEMCDKIYDIVEKYPLSLDLFIANGFEQFSNKKMFDMMAKMVSLEDALKSKNISAEIFEDRLVSFIEDRYGSDKVNTGLEAKSLKADVNIEGVLPCPIRIPLLEGFESWAKSKKDEFDFTFDYELKSANLGLDWIKEQMKTGDINKVPELLTSAGFDLFFDDELMGKYIDDFDVIESEMNRDFENDYISLKDPKGKYHIIGVVPAVMLVNKNVLGERPMPRTWEDILKPEFENSVAIPMQDLDLFNAIIVHIYKFFGMDGIKKLAKAFKKNLHPAQMVKAKRKVSESEPAISITPYFFTQMIDENGPIEAVWPEDGAIISPIFMMAKKDDKNRVKNFVDFFMSKEVGEVFSANGKFPSTNPGVDNKLDEDKKFMWIGWDFIEKNNIGKLIRELEGIFESEVMA